MLMSRCEGEALEAIQFCNMKAPEEEFKMAMKKLKERFGDTARVAQAWIKKVTTDYRYMQEISEILQMTLEIVTTY